MRKSIALLLSLAATGCGSEVPYSKPLTPVRAQVIQQANPSTASRYSAGVEPRTRVDLAFRSGGHVETLAMIGGRVIQDGDPVVRGMVLARLRSVDYLEQINQARSQLSEAEAGLETARPAFDRATRLYEARSLTRPEFEQARAAVGAMEAKVEGARALVRSAEIARDETALSSPIDGIVIKRLVEVGSFVGPGTSAFVVADVSEVKAVFGAPDTMLRTLAVGVTAPVTAEAVPGRVFRGRITKISPAADPRSRIFEVEVTVSNADRALRVGMVTSIRIGQDPGGVAPTDAVVLLLPLSAIVRGETGADSYAVFVLDETGASPVARRRPVTLGTVVGNQITALDGLREGEKVIVSGATIVSDGESVNVVR